MHVEFVLHVGTKSTRLTLGGLEPRPPLLAVELGRLGLGDEALEDGDEAAGRSSWGRWPTPSKISRRLPGSGAWAASAWATGMIGSLLAPDDQQRQGLGEVEPSRAATRWPSVPTTERRVARNALRRSGSASERVTAGDLGDVGVGRRPSRPSPRPSTDPTRLPDAGGGGDEEIGARAVPPRAGPG